MTKNLNRALHDYILRPPAVLTDSIECQESRRNYVATGLTSLSFYGELRHFLLFKRGLGFLQTGTGIVFLDIVFFSIQKGFSQYRITYMNEKNHLFFSNLCNGENIKNSRFDLLFVITLPRKGIYTLQ